jgi:hypothetical protein
MIIVPSVVVVVPLNSIKIDQLAHALRDDNQEIGFFTKEMVRIMNAGRVSMLDLHNPNKLKNVQSRRSSWDET